MPACEKCWHDAKGDADEYARLLLKRSHKPCTPEEQAGGGEAMMCPYCGRYTRHVHTGKCVICKC